ncbi:truncated fructose-specific PTS system IIC component [Spiroplasma mirum ATCC 29335]|nr:truncated fructose-specific PTS system IIC component [Spiroplasma mirum ATCC 29335]
MFNTASCYGDPNRPIRGCALTSTVLGRKLFTAQEKSLGWNAWLLGFMRILELAKKKNSINK